MAFDPRTIAIDEYHPRTWRIECQRCRRAAVLDRYEMNRRYGGQITLAECAKRVAALKGCNLAAIHGGPGCSVRVFETDVSTWARLADARYGGWQAYATCHRRFAALKKADSCPEAIPLDIHTLVALLGDNFPLEHLQAKLKCPMCGTAHVEVTWYVPEPPNTPAPIQERPAEPIRLRPHGAALARTKLGLIED